MTSRFRITLASLPDRENLVAEILYDNVERAKFSTKNNNLKYSFILIQERSFWEFPLNEALSALEKAKAKLLEK